MTGRTTIAYRAAERRISIVSKPIGHSAVDHVKMVTRSHRIRLVSHRARWTDRHPDDLSSAAEGDRPTTLVPRDTFERSNCVMHPIPTPQAALEREVGPHQLDGERLGAAHIRSRIDGFFVRRSPESMHFSRLSQKAIASVTDQ